MPIDSTADLLFRISANTDDAETNIQRFRTILNKDLNTLGTEFEEWATKVFGSLNTVKGAMTAGIASVAAGVTALAAMAADSAHRYAELVEQVDDGSDKTGIAVEEMSKLRFAAQATGTDYGMLVNSLVKFSSSIVQANAGAEQQIQAFGRLKISRQQLANGEQNLLPLLMQVADRFHEMQNGTQKAAIARDLFSRGGADLIEFLNRGSVGLRALTSEAERLGLVMGEQDVLAAKQYKLALAELKAQKEALDISIGQKTLPLLVGWKIGWAALLETLTSKTSHSSLAGFAADWSAAVVAIREQVESLSKGAMETGTDTLLPPVPKLKEAKQEWYGLSSIMETVRMQTAGTVDEQARATAEIQHLQFELQKASKEFEALRASSKLTADSLTRESKTLAELPAAIATLAAELQRQITEKRNLEIAQAHEELLSRLRSQEERTWATERAGLDSEMTTLALHLQKKGQLTQENEELIHQIRSSGMARIAREQSDAFEQELLRLQSHLAQVVQANMTQQERLAYQYDLDVQALSEAEEAKSLKTATEEGQREAMRQQYALNQNAVLQKYGRDLQALYNSQGWQGVLGREFGENLRWNEEAFREWAESADQAFSMVRLSSEALGGWLIKLFDNLTKAMAQNVAYAIVYKQSIVDAMRQALAATLETSAAEAYVMAIKAAALGFMRLAEFQFAAAAQAFTSAGLWASVGTAAAVAGRAIAPSQKGSDGAAGASETSGASGGSASTQSGSDTQQGPHTTIIVNGSIIGPSGVDELAAMLNDAVLNRDVSLYSTATKRAGKMLW